MPFTTVNPATGEAIEDYCEMPASLIQALIEKTRQAFDPWKRTPLARRAELLKNTATVLRANTRRCAELMTAEMGKPIAQSRAEVEKCAWACEHFAGSAADHLADMHITTEMRSSYVTFAPLGIVLAIMPWNFPFWQVFRCAAPALMAGNTLLLKHARNTMGCAVAIEGIFREAGLPEHVFTNLIIGSEPVAAIIKHPDVAAVTLTGSTGAGCQVAATAGAHIKKTVLELGGSDPYIILRDADLERAVDTCVAARLINSGQSCVAAKRFIVERPVYREFCERFADTMRRQTMGDPMDTSVTVGPQARRDLLLELKRQCDASVAAGAVCTAGGDVPGGMGCFYPPTVLIDVTQGMPVYDEETFGPLAAVIPVDSEAEAIAVANDSLFGLGAAIFSRDTARAEQIAKEHLHAGVCFVNEFVTSDPRLPFGGVKQSGYGRELSVFGIREFVNIKTVCVP
jgi:succinate-semialdehyde dehydrogenase / glutarate-semialdehyde dehydrogenase